MVRYLNYIIKRIIIGVGIALALMFIKGNLLLNTNAQVLVNNNQLSYNNYLVIQPGSSQFHFYDNTVYQDISIFPQYFLLTTCTDSNNINSWSIANNSLINVNFYNTQISCIFPNSSYTGGHITYIYGQVNPSTSCSTNGTSCYQNGYINFTVPNRSSWALLSYQLSKDSINIDYGSNTIINQNQMILSGQQSIINNQNQNTQDIINNQNQNTQDIIDNQNANSQAQIDSSMICNFYDKSSIVSNNKFLLENGTLANSSGVGVTDFIPISRLDKLTILSSNDTGSFRYCFYNVNKSNISCFVSSNITDNSLLDIPFDASYIMFSINTQTNKPQYKLCRNGNQALEDTLTDDSGVSDSDISDLFGDLQESNSPISDLLTLPITLLQAYLTGFEGTCSSYNLGSLYGTNLVLPCIDIPHYIGSNLWSLLDALCCIYMIYNIAMMFVSVYESFTSLDDSMQLLYSPQHSNSRVAQRGGSYDG